MITTYCWNKTTN